MLLQVRARKPLDCKRLSLRLLLVAGSLQSLILRISTLLQVESKKTIGLQEVVATTAGGGWLVAETDFEDQHASAGESKETIGLQEVVATTAAGGWLAAESDLEDQHASAGREQRNHCIARGCRSGCWWSRRS